MSSPGPDAPAPLEWHRVDRGKGVRRTLALAAVLVTSGATAVGGGFVSRLSEATGHTIALVGACTMLAGLVLGAGMAVVMIQDDAYLAVRADGVLLHWGRDDEAILAWDAIRAIDVDASAIVFRLENDETETWPVPVGAAELARRLRELKQKAAHGLL
jgi:hypothetical protein